MKPSHLAIGIAVLAISLFFFLGLSGISGEEGYAACRRASRPRWWRSAWPCAARC